MHGMHASRASVRDGLRVMPCGLGFWSRRHYVVVLVHSATIYRHGCWLHKAASWKAQAYWPYEQCTGPGMFPVDWASPMLGADVGWVGVAAPSCCQVSVVVCFGSSPASGIACSAPLCWCEFGVRMHAAGSGSLSCKCSRREPCSICSGGLFVRPSASSVSLLCWWLDSCRSTSLFLGGLCVDRSLMLSLCMVDLCLSFAHA